MKFLVLLCLPFLIFAQENIDPQKIIDQSIKKHGGKNYTKKSFQFDFRNRTYTYQNKKGNYTYTRSFDSQEGAIKDELTNAGLERSVNGSLINLDPIKKTAYRNSVNSVIYFAMLPYFLNDAAVKKKYVGTISIKDQEYHKVKVTFAQEGGGPDHDDIYMYWIHAENHTVDYLAYSYEVNGGGVRFRSAYNTRRVGGVLFQDYINYKHDKTTPVEDLDIYYNKGELKELSRIELLKIVTF